MDDLIRVQPEDHAWLHGSVLGPHISNYYCYLQKRQYAANTRRIYIRCVAHFAHWLRKHRYQLKSIRRAVDRFLTEHLPYCSCRKGIRRLVHENRAALRHLLNVLKDSGVIAPNQEPASHLLDELLRFDTYMEQTRGLALSTRTQRLTLMRRFLTQRFGFSPVVVAHLRPVDITRFMFDQTNTWRAGSLHVIRSALRCYLQFRRLAGDQVQHLLMGVPSVANWRLAPLPEVLSEMEIEQLLRSFDQPFPSCKRAYAMMRCLLDLGLRCGEVVRLCLDDIDWHAGTIRVKASKSRRIDLLPLPAKTGRAITNYLISERPPTSNRAVFVRHVAPRDEPIGTGVVQRAVHDAYRRCGWNRRGAHILRHTVATRLLRVGTPLKEIADILRHRNLDTSLVYTKLDVDRLAAVGLSWPGSVS
jgi:integrase